MSDNWQKLLALTAHPMEEASAKLKTIPFSRSDWSRMIELLELQLLVPQVKDVEKIKYLIKLLKDSHQIYEAAVYTPGILSCNIEGEVSIPVYDSDSAFKLRDAIKLFGLRKNEVFDYFIKEADRFGLFAIRQLLLIARDYEEVPPIGPEPSSVMSFPCNF